MSTNGNQQAFPLSETEFMDHVPGLTKREWFAGLAMQGLLACPQFHDADADVIARWSVGQADALLAELAKEPAP